MAKLCFKSQLWEVRRSCSFTEIQIKLLTLFISWIFRVEVPCLSHHRIHHRKVAKDKEYFWVSQNHNNFNSAITYPLLSRYAAACIQQPLIDEVAGEPYHSACTNDTKSGRKQGWILETKLMKLLWSWHSTNIQDQSPESNRYRFRKRARWSPRTRMLTRMLMVQMSKHMVMQSRTIPFCNSLFEQSCACFPCYQSAVWSGKCRVWSVECEVRSVECKVWSGECRVCKV